MVSGATRAPTIVGWLLVGGGLLAPVAAAPQLQDADVMGGGRAAGRLRVLWENDSWFSNSDRFYTNGAAIGFTVPDGPLAATLASSLDWLPLRAPAITGSATEFTLAQEMFTPENIAVSTPVLDDRPYAGWLHLDTRHQILALDRARRQDMLDTWLLQLGVVGPSSLADDAQLQVHEMVGAPRPQGWANQLHDEPGLGLGFRRDFRGFHDPHWILGLESDFEGHYGLLLGNVETSARVGAQLRLGQDLPRHFGTSIVCPGADEPWRWFATAGISGRAIARDIFLDGNTYRDSHGIDRNHLVADLHVGLHFEWRCVRIGVARVFRTPEFDSPSQAGDPSSWMSVQIEVLF